MATITAALKSILNNKMGAQAKRIGLGTLLESVENTITTGVADDSVTTAKILDANVTAAKLASDAVTTAKIASEAVTTAKLPDSAITAAKLATDAVESDKIKALAVTTAKLAANAVTEAKIAAPSASALNVKRCLLGVFDATAGKEIGTHTIAAELPDNAIVTRVDYEVITTFTSETDAATIALTLDSAGDVKAAIAISNGANPWDADVPKVTLVTGATSAYIKTTAARTLSATVAVEALTAGVLRVYADYVLSV